MFIDLILENVFKKEENITKNSLKNKEPNRSYLPMLKLLRIEKIIN